MRDLLKFGSQSRESRDVPLAEMPFVVIDTELTSLDDRTNRLLSVGAVAMTGPRIHLGEQFYRVANPGVNVPAQSVVIHKLRPSDIDNAEAISRVISDLQVFIKQAVLVGHFAEVDRNVLRKEFASAGLELTNPMVCTARVQRWIVRKQPYSEDQFRQIEQLDLASLAKLYNLEVREAHHALDDAYLTACLWQKMIHRLPALGVNSLPALLKIAKV